jgi:hypothetical protein
MRRTFISDLLDPGADLDSTSGRQPDASPVQRGRSSSTAAGSIVSPLVMLVAVAVDVGAEVIAIVAILVNVLVVGANVVLVIVATSATIAAENAAEAGIEDDHAVLFSPSPCRHLSSRLLPARRPSVPTQRISSFRKESGYSTRPIRW